MRHNQKGVKVKKGGGESKPGEREGEMERVADKVEKEKERGGV